MLGARKLLPIVVLMVGTPAAGCAPGPAPEGVVVFAAASTIDALEAAATDFEETRGVAVSLSFGATSTIARQLVAGAPAGLLLAASSDWADFVRERVEIDEHAIVATNRLVVAVPVSARPAARDVAGVLMNPDIVGRIAIADPDSAPAGVYARQALRNLGLWEGLQPLLVPTLDVRAALVLVARGEADAGVVYRSDVGSSAQVVEAAAIDPGLHAPIEYPLLLLGGANTASRQFFDYLTSEEGRAHFLSRGFSAPEQPPQDAGAGRRQAP